MDFKQINAIIRFYLPQYEPDDLITINKDGSFNFDKYVEIWTGLDWYLQLMNKQKAAV